MTGCDGGRTMGRTTTDLVGRHWGIAVVWPVIGGVEWWWKCGYLGDHVRVSGRRAGAADSAGAGRISAL